MKRSRRETEQYREMRIIGLRKAYLLYNTPSCCQAPNPSLFYSIPCIFHFHFQYIPPLPHPNSPIQPQSFISHLIFHQNKTLPYTLYPNLNLNLTFYFFILEKERKKIPSTSIDSQNENEKHHLKCPYIHLLEVLF